MSLTLPIDGTGPIIINVWTQRVYIWSGRPLKWWERLIYADPTPGWSSRY